MQNWAWRPSKEEEQKWNYDSHDESSGLFCQYQLACSRGCYVIITYFFISTPIQKRIHVTYS